MALEIEMQPLSEDYTLDLDQWLALFPLDRMRSEIVERFGADHLWNLGGVAISSPQDLAIVEQIRSEMSLQYDLGNALPVDLFVFAKGEPQRRDVTKIGGLPYRPAGLPWPCGEAGEPLTFLAQFRFTESFDIVGDLPGEFLLVFVRDEAPDVTDDPSPFVFEWHSSEYSDLIQQDDLPAAKWEFVTCYGIRHRTVDWPDDCCSEAACQHLPEQAVWWNVCRFEGTKIGGAPFWIQPDDVNPEVDLPGKFLCTLGSISPAADVPYPWVNQESSVALDDCLRSELSLDWGDSGTLYFSIDESNEIHWLIQYY